MKKNMLIVLIIVFVLIVAGIIIFSFSVKDKGKEEVSEDNKTALVKENISEVAKEFGRLSENDNYEELYERQSPEIKKYKTKEEFVKLYPLVFGKYSIRSMVVNKIEEEGNLSFVHYDITYSSGYKELSGSYNFINIEGKWYFDDGFAYLIYAGCIELKDCGEGLSGEKLKEICKYTCERRAESSVFVEDSPFICNMDEHQCYCTCWNKEKTSGKNVLPDFV